MATTKKQPERLTDAQLADLLALSRDADSVELKLTVPTAEQRATVTALGMDPLNGQIRQVFFFDTPDLALNRHGVVVRARRVQGRGDDSVVKLRPVVPNDLPKALRRSKNFVVEVDAMPGGYVCSASMKGTLGTTDVTKVTAGDRAIRKLYSKEQRAFFAAYGPSGVDLDGLSTLGPITVLKLKMAPGDFGRRLVAELWLYPDGSRILELSTKCAPAEAFQVAAESRAFLEEKGLNLSGEQHTKTKTALEFFAGQLAGPS
ncbi:MAG: hypothetical protein ACRDP9_05775 [Kribbellaceae bacterium]